MPFLAPELSATSRTLPIWIIASSPQLASALGDLPHLPPLGLRAWTAGHDHHFVPDSTLVGLVVGREAPGLLHVALVEKEASIGGKMIALSKVFPTLDCCSCITTPKMSAVAHHPNIDLLTYCEVQNVCQNGGGFKAQVIKKPRYVDEDKCTACNDCVAVCPKGVFFSAPASTVRSTRTRCLWKLCWGTGAFSKPDRRPAKPESRFNATSVQTSPECS